MAVIIKFTKLGDPKLNISAITKIQFFKQEPKPSRKIESVNKNISQAVFLKYATFSPKDGASEGFART